MNISSSKVDFSREPLLSPFGFKGAYLLEAWQARVSLCGSKGGLAEASATQGVLWSDPQVFLSLGEAAGNAAMLLSSAEAARIATGLDWDDPTTLQKRIFQKVHARAGEVSGRGASLRQSFTLNSMVALDNAAWLLMAKEKGIDSFDAMIPERYRKLLDMRHGELACIPLISYGVGADGIRSLLDSGSCILKIKIGADPDKDGDLDKMLEWDKRRISEIHGIAKDRATPFTESGHVLYYLDANGRYDSLERVGALLDHARSVGALERTVIFEEPFPEEMKIDVSSLPVRVAADESAHSAEDVEERISLGYGAIALKPIAKTLSMSLEMLAVARPRGVPCFCADLTVTPELVEWNKSFAARIPPLPGMKVGVVESNGSQNYRNWKSMLAKHPFAGAPWIEPVDGVFRLGGGFYERSGGIFNWSR